MNDTYTLKNGLILSDRKQVGIMEKLLELRPHAHTMYPWNDIGLGNLYAEIYRGQACYNEDSGTWMIYEKGIWRPDKREITSQGMMQNLLHLMDFYVSEIAHELDESMVKAYKRYINQSSSDTVLRRALNSAKPNMVVKQSQFDQAPYLLKCVNGVYDLRKQEFRPAFPEDYFTLSTNAMYPLALINPMERWYSFIDEIMSGNKEKAHFLQKALGYSLLGVAKEECMFIAYGEKLRNGKGTLFNTIKDVLGSYAGAISSSLICESKYKEVDYNAPEPMLADTVGVRYLTLSETKKNAKLDTNTIKSLTGRDPRKTRQLHQAAFTFTPQFTMWLSTNFLPKISDIAIFNSDRIWVIPFDAYFGEETRDTGLKELFQSDNAKMTILKWLVDGYRMYAEEGLNPPECVRNATIDYMVSNDRVLAFQKDCLEPAEGCKVSNAMMYAAYKKWCADPERDYQPMGTTSFYKGLEKLCRRVDSHGFRGFVDVKLIDFPGS